MHVVLGQEIALDSAAADRVKKDSPPPKAFEKEHISYEDSSTPVRCLDRAQTRATLFFKLNNLINGKSKCRLAVLEALASMLNSNIVPILPSGELDSVALRALAEALHGLGSTVGGDNILPTSQALEEAGIAVPGLSAVERTVIEDSQCASAATGAVCVQSGRALITAATAIAALSAEALQADVSYTNKHDQSSFFMYHSYYCNCFWATSPRAYSFFCYKNIYIFPLCAIAPPGEVL